MTHEPRSYKELTRSEKLSIKSKGNLARASNPMSTYLRRRVLLRPEDRACVTVAQRMAEALVQDKGGSDNATAAELALIENAAISRTVVLIALREMSERGSFVESESGRVASAGTLAVLKALAAERQAIQALGLERRVRQLESLTDVLGGAVVDAEVVK